MVALTPSIYLSLNSTISLSTSVCFMRCLLTLLVVFLVCGPLGSSEYVTVKLNLLFDILDNHLYFKVMHPHKDKF